MTHKRFTPEEDEFLRQNAGTMTITELARKLNRNVSSVWRRTRMPEGSHLKKKRVPRIAPLTQHEIDYILKNRPTMTWREISRDLNRPLRWLMQASRDLIPARKKRPNQSGQRITVPCVMTKELKGIIDATVGSSGNVSAWIEERLWESLGGRPEEKRCPACQSEFFQKNGKDRTGRQRYRCANCNKQFQ